MLVVQTWLMALSLIPLSSRVGQILATKSLGGQTIKEQNTSLLQVFFDCLINHGEVKKNVTVDAKPAVKAALRLCKDVPVLKFNTNFETRCPTIADVSTKIVLASNNKHLAVYQAGKINTTKLTDALLKHNDVSNEVIH